MATKYPPYVNAYGKIGDILGGIKSAAVPPKFTQDFLSTVLGLTSSSYRAMIPLLKRLNFLDVNSVPTQAYKDYRDESNSKYVLAKQIKDAYSGLFSAHEYAHKLKKDEVTSKLKTVLGISDDDANLPYVVGTFLELIKHADFEEPKKGKEKKKPKEDDEGEGEQDSKPPGFGNGVPPDRNMKLGISYTINLNLPATTEIEVFNAIFKSLKENLLKD